MKKSISLLFACALFAGSLSAADLPQSCYEYKKEAQKVLDLAEKIADKDEKELAKVGQMRQEFDEEFKKLKPGNETDAECKDMTMVVKNLYEIFKEIEALGKATKP